MRAQIKLDTNIRQVGESKADHAAKLFRSSVYRVEPQGLIDRQAGSVARMPVSAID